MLVRNCSNSEVLPSLKPFSLLDVAAERERISQLFTEESAAILRDYFLQRSSIGQAEEIQIILGNFPSHDAPLLLKGSELVDDIRQTITMYHSISEDMRFCFDGLRKFIGKLDDAERYDEAHKIRKNSKFKIQKQAPFPTPLSLNNGYVRNGAFQIRMRQGWVDPPHPKGGTAKYIFC